VPGRKFLFLGAISLGVALGLATAWLIWFHEDTKSAWTIDDPEQVVPYPGDGKTAQATFRIRNCSRSALRVLGTNAC
jgi:hypothetical protein